MSGKQLSLGECRLIVVNHFDAVTSEIDLFIENKLRVYSRNKAKLARFNENREIMLKEVREAERLNLKHLNENLANSLDSLAGDISKLFVVFWFALTYNKTIHLITTEEYIPESQLNLYRKVVEVSCSHKSIKNLGKSLGEEIFVPIEGQVRAQNISNTPLIIF
jgi:hypothetical protein